MLVLSRRLNEKIVFPGISTTVQVLSVKPGIIRLGIEAPPEITVLREELAGRALPSPKEGDADRIKAATARLAVLRRQIEAGQTEQAKATLDLLERELQGDKEEAGRATDRCRCAAAARR